MAQFLSNIASNITWTLDHCWSQTTNPGTVAALREKTISHLALSMIKTAAMTALTTATTIAIGFVSYFSLIPTVFSRNPTFSLFAANIANIVSSLLLGVGIAKNKKVLTCAALIAQTAGFLVIFSAGSEVFLFLMPIMGILSIISLIVALVVRACHSEKLAIKTIAAQLFYILGTILIRSLKSSGLFAILAILGATVSFIAKRYGYTTIAKIASAIAIVSFMATLSSCFNYLDFDAKAIAMSALAAIAAGVTIIDKGYVSKTIRDFIATFLGSAVTLFLVSLIGNNALRIWPLTQSMFIAFGSVATQMCQES